MARRRRRREEELSLRERWRSIEEEADSDPDAVDAKAKASWFSDAFDFLMDEDAEEEEEEEEEHIWCHHSHLMAPLLETFHAFSSPSAASANPLPLLWARLSRQLSLCTQCVCLHHQAQLSYASDFHPHSVAPLLLTLRRLDEDRVTALLNRLNANLRSNHYDPARDAPHVVTVMFEVLMFPVLLDDMSLANQFQLFIEAIDHSYQLTLSTDQHYPGVFALLFFSTGKARAIGLRLARCMGKFRLASDLEPLQPLLKKWISFLETDVPPTDNEALRPRVQLKRADVWLGIKSLLGFLDGPAFEDGILERYPVFLNIILNHVSDDTSDFSYAVSCLKASFEMLGCKLWLKASLSPSVMRNTLLGHCFHTRDEKSHKDIFDLFIPFLQSLEALQDGEHEKQRRNILYFLLHQVTRSSNFSVFTRQNACKIAILIVYRGYTMEPPSPPFECAHMWGPSLVSALKDKTLHSSLRQPAFDLINSIIISDACALVSKLLSLSKASIRSLFDEEEDTVLSKDAEKDKSYWTELCSQWNLTLRECIQWRCIPLLWYTALLQIYPVDLPISFSMAIFLVLSHVSVANLGSGNELMSLSVDEWLVSHAGKISWCFKWEIPSGSDDGGDGKESLNSVEVATTTCTLLMRALKRFSVHFVVQLVKLELQKQWTWTPAMAESLVLFLVDPNDSIRQAGRAILESASQNKMLTAGLQFLCCGTSLSAMHLGLRYALGLVQVNPIPENFHNLHHIFFVARKLLKEVVNPDQSPESLHKGPLSTPKAMEGGFIRQPGFSYPSSRPPQSTISPVDMQYWEQFCYSLSAILWPFIVNCLEKGGVIFDEKRYEMASVRLLEMLPCVVERLSLGLSSTREEFAPVNLPFQDLAWLSYLANWGKSSLIVLTRHWKQCIISVLQILIGSLTTGPTQLFLDLEAMVSKDKIDIEKFLEKVSACKTSAFSKEAPHATTRQQVRLLDAIATDRTPLGNDIPSLVIQEARRPSTKMETDKVLSAKRDMTDRLEQTTAGSADILRKPVPLDGGDCCEGKKSITPSEMAEPAVATAKEPLKPPEPARPSEKKQFKPPANEESLLKQIVQDDQPDPLDAALGKARQPPIPLSLTKTLTIPPKRQVVQLPMPNGNRNASFGNRNTTVMRFKHPKFDQWYKEILQMDYFTAAGVSKNDQKEKEPNVSLKKVPLSFGSERQYLEIFKPLVLEEFKAQLRAAYMESSMEDMVCGSFCVLSVERVDEFLVVRGRPDEKEFLKNQGGCLESDLILLTKEPFKNTEQSVHVLGLVERREKGDKNQSIILVIRLLISNEVARFNKVRKFLIVRSKWFLNRVFNLTPQKREFQALSSLHDIPIMPAILNPLIEPVSSAGFLKAKLDRLGGPIKSFLTTSYNDSQLQAIDVAIRSIQAGKNFELSLIQGPPGTGKTRTIVAIVSALLASPLVQRKNFSASCTSLHSCAGSSQGRNPTKLCQSSSVARAWQDLPLAKQLMMESGLQHQVSSSEGAERSLKGRVLICAQSNAAVDELLSRLSEGLIGNDGQMYKPYIVRVGNQKTIHPSSLPFFIDTLVEQKVSEDMKSKADAKAVADFESTISLRARLEKVVEDIRKYETRRAKLDSNDGEDKPTDKVSVSRDESHDVPDEQINAKLNALHWQKRDIISDLKIAHANEKRIAEENRGLRQRVRKQILMDAQIVVATLSGAGGDLYSVCSEAASAGKFGNISENTLFDVVIIDEAAQALEPATLIPLQLLKSKGTKCVMVGDPKQLPATVISNIASKFSYECSMFERLQRAGHPVIMLTEQFRMHPEICRFPSLHFYDGKLLNGVHIEDRLAPFHGIKCLGPYMFFDVTDGRERHGRSGGSQSLFNESEAEAATEILRFLNKRYPSELTFKKIGIITPYRSQLSLLQSKFNSTFGPEAVSDMELNTVDGFQGREVDILLLCTVRASSSNESDCSGTGSIGFVADVRRMNVALTRAKFSLWIFGNARTLQVNPHWTALIQDARKRNLFTSISRPYSSAFTKEQPQSLLDSMHKDTRMSSGGKQAEQSMRMPPERGRVKRFGESMQKDTRINSRGKQPEQSIRMPMPGRESVKRFGPGESMKRAIDEVAVRGSGGGSCGYSKTISESKGISQNAGATSSVLLELKGGKRSLVDHVKEAAKKLSSKNCDGAGIAPSKQTQTKADSSKGKHSHSVMTERRKVMPMPTQVPRGLKGTGSSSSDKNRGRGGEAGAGERKGGKAEGGVGPGGNSVLNSARKRRREDVDSLLPSAFISSRKKP
ncbi:hypothetical protein LUZ63_000011 [Rhynchospora breviuscula]|uniref:Uncharacterized protein n=1 Tax=Rhynchospora breviuscula TaxID=2022672 RepID=A0A9Q0CU71_9POAL|nr:hypothetical protein LUZ63_000011 [Rhynchospora breviuscula]